MRSYRATHNLIAVSANNAETAINTEQTIDTSMLVSLTDVINLEPRRESNAGELTGKEEPDNIYDLGGLSAATFNFEKAQPQHFAFLMAYGLSAISTAAAGTGYAHTITPISNDTDANRSNESFTAMQRYGDTILKRRFASMFVDSFTATFAKDSWCKITGDIKGTGKYTDNVTEETVSALNDAVSLTLAANDVEGADAATRLDNVQRIKAETSSGVWEEVTYTVVSDATPAVITIATLGGDGLSNIDYKILYVPGEPAWCTFPARVTETPLRVSEMTVTQGGTWDGSDFLGGKDLCAEVSAIEWTCNNNTSIEFTPCSGGAYANRAFREGRDQVVKLDREFRDFIIQQHVLDNDTFGLRILAEGAIFDTPHKYTVDIVFPKLAVLNAPLSINGKRLAEAGDMVVLEDDTYGSVIVVVKNLQATYMV